MQGDYLANKYRLRNIKTLNDYFPPHEFCFAVYRNPELLNLLNEGLIILQNNGEHKQIYQKWLETTDKNELIMSRWFKHVVIVALVLVMIVIVSMFWIWYLRRVVSSRTRELQVEIQNKKQIEEALRASEENFRSLAENAFDGILINDENGNYLYANSNAAEISGYSVSSLTKLSIKDLTPEDDYQKILNLSIDRIKGRPVRRVYESFLQRKDGTIIPIEVAASKTLWHNKPADTQAEDYRISLSESRWKRQWRTVRQISARLLKNPAMPFMSGKTIYLYWLIRHWSGYWSITARNCWIRNLTF